jgi:hypothetical protein
LFGTNFNFIITICGGGGGGGGDEILLGAFPRKETMVFKLQ